MCDFIFFGWCYFLVKWVILEKKGLGEDKEFSFEYEFGVFVRDLYR